jgi:hypothetical protein
MITTTTSAWRLGIITLVIMICIFSASSYPIEMNHGSLGILPGLFESNQGLLSQNSSLIMSTCCTVILALALRFLSFSSCVLDSATCSTVFTKSSSITSGVDPGSTSSY